MNGQQAAGGGIGVSGALGVLFIGLKLTGYLTWSWLWVLAPLWIPVLTVVALLLIAGMVGLASTWFDYRRRVKREQQLADRQREREGLPPANMHGPAFWWGRRGR